MTLRTIALPMIFLPVFWQQQQAADFPQSSPLVDSPAIQVPFGVGINLTILTVWKS